MKTNIKIVKLIPKNTEYKTACNEGLQFVTIAAIGIIVMLSLLMWSILQGVK